MYKVFYQGNKCHAQEIESVTDDAEQIDSHIAYSGPILIVEDLMDAASMLKIKEEDINIQQIP